jgi:hypothetical protein
MVEKRDISQKSRYKMVVSIANLTIRRAERSLTFEDHLRTHKTHFRLRYELSRVNTARMANLQHCICPRWRLTLQHSVLDFVHFCLVSPDFNLLHSFTPTSHPLYFPFALALCVCGGKAVFCSTYFSCS